MVNANVLYLLYTNFSFYTVELLVSCALYNFVGGRWLCSWMDGGISATKELEERISFFHKGKAAKKPPMMTFSVKF